MATAKKTIKKTIAKDSMKSFAVIATGGKQYLVKSGDIISVEKIEGTFNPGDTNNFDQVLLKDDGSTTTIGAPTIKGALVTASFIEAGRGKKN